MARVYRPAVKRAELAPLRFHDLRHTYAALMVAAGAHAKLLQAQMGHSSITVTLDLYGHYLPGDGSARRRARPPRRRFHLGRRRGRGCAIPAQ